MTYPVPFRKVTVLTSPVLTPYGVTAEVTHGGKSKRGTPFGRNPWAPPRVYERGESLRKAEEGGIPGGEVKFIDTGRKAESEGSPLPLA